MPDKYSRGWETDLRAAYRHYMSRTTRSPGRITLFVSNEMAMNIQNSHPHSYNVDISKHDVTWRGMPLRLDATLPPGCFIFEEGGENGND